MFIGREDWIGNHIYVCPKCEKKMVDNPDTILIHDKKFCLTKKNEEVNDASQKPDSEQPDSEKSS